MDKRWTPNQAAMKFAHSCPPRLGVTRSDAKVMLREAFDRGKIRGEWQRGKDSPNCWLDANDVNAALRNYLNNEYPLPAGRTSKAAEDEPFVTRGMQLIRDQKVKNASEAARIIMTEGGPTGASAEATQLRLARRISKRLKEELGSAP